MEKDIFCKIIDGELPSNTCYEDDFVLCIMDVTPVHPGHNLIVPKKHITTILDMDNDTLISIHNAAKIMIKKMEKNLPGITGVKAVVNYGSEQAIKHYHLHLIPFYDAKSSLSQDEAYELLKK